MIVRVVDGVPRQIPESPSDDLRQIIDQVCRMSRDSSPSVQYKGPAPAPPPGYQPLYCAFNPRDLVIGSSEQLALLKRFLASADRRLIIHSTFLGHESFSKLLDDVRTACNRGVEIDLLWGTDPEKDKNEKNLRAALAIAATVRSDPELHNRFTVHLSSSRSHSKVLLADQKDGNWIAAVSSCNWLDTPFKSTELTAVLRDPHVVADVATALQRLTGKYGVVDEIAAEMSELGSRLRRRPPIGGPARIRLVAGPTHDALMRRASGEARDRVVIGSHRMGAVARTGMIIPAEVAASRPDVDVAIIYSNPSGPVTNKQAREAERDAAREGVNLTRTQQNAKLHGKFLAWDNDNLVITSLNWGSARSDSDFPEGELGVHIELADISAEAISQLERRFPFISRSGDAGSIDNHQG
jgi:cardiolipin synthase